MMRVRFSLASLDIKQLLSICPVNHSQQTMNNSTAHSVITNTYDYETCKEIVNHGCVSGVCFKHIYYADTISFFDKYEDEVLTYIEDVLERDTLVELFEQADANLDQYKNLCTWTFIELVAMDVVNEMEAIEYEQDTLIESYMQPA